MTWHDVVPYILAAYAITHAAVYYRYVFTHSNV